MIDFIHSSIHKEIQQKLTNHARKVLLGVANVISDFKHPTASSMHLLYAIYLEKGSLGSNLLKDIGLSSENLVSFLKKKSFSANTDDSYLGKILIRSYFIAKNNSCSYVGTEHLLYALIQNPTEEIFQIIPKNKLESLLHSLRLIFDPEQSPLPKIFDFPEIILPSKKRSPASKTPFIQKFCLDINRDAKEKKEIVIGRKKEISRMIHILNRKNKNNPLLIGDPGVGKTALVSGLAQLFDSPSAPQSLYQKKIVGLDVAQLIAGTGFRGEFESRLKEIIKEASQHKNILLFIDEVHTIIGAGNIPGSLDLANILKPALARGEIQIIGATTHEEYKKHIEKDSALERRFQPIYLEEPTPEEAKKIILGIRKNYEEFHNVIISKESVEKAVDLSIRYIKNRFLPDKVIDVIDEAAAQTHSKRPVSGLLKKIALLKNQKKSLLKEKEQMVLKENYTQAVFWREKEQELEKQIKIIEKQYISEKKDSPIEISPIDIMKTVSEISKIPFEKIANEKNGKLRNIKRVLQKQLVGQNDALEKVTHALLRSQSGISESRRPIGSFIFLGPTGVGKTFLAKLIAQEFFDEKKSLIRIDMSELTERHNISSLIGAPAGYIGYGEGGRLTEKVRRYPHSVVLFDEIEKSHPDVFNILLQILEDGILTDAEGTSIDFKNTLIILTSNIGTSEFINASSIGFEEKEKEGKIEENYPQIKDRVIRELEKKIKPELLNRLDDILVFNPLGENEIKKIVALEIAELTKRLAKQKITLLCDKQVNFHIAKKSLALNQGARFVRKNIRELLENPIAEMIVDEKISASTISASLSKDKIFLQ